MAEKTGANTPADNRAQSGERAADRAADQGAEATWGAPAHRKQEWDDKHGDAARKAGEKAYEER